MIVISASAVLLFLLLRKVGLVYVATCIKSFARTTGQNVKARQVRCICHFAMVIPHHHIDRTLSCMFFYHLVRRLDWFYLASENEVESQSYIGLANVPDWYDIDIWV